MLVSSPRPISKSHGYKTLRAHAPQRPRPAAPPTAEGPLHLKLRVRGFVTELPGAGRHSGCQDWHQDWGAAQGQLPSGTNAPPPGLQRRWPDDTCHPTIGAGQAVRLGEIAGCASRERTEHMSAHTSVLCTWRAPMAPASGARPWTLSLRCGGHTGGGGVSHQACL